MSLIMKYISYEAAVETVKDFFSNTDKDIVSLQDIYKTTGRPLDKPELNKSWVTNKMTHLKHYQLVTPIYTYGKRRTLDKIQLTEQGRRALNERKSTKPPSTTLEETGYVTDNEKNTVSFDSVKKDVEILQAMHPSLEIIYDVRLRKEE